MDIIDQIKQLAKQYREEVIHYRRHLHMHPELSFEERETGRYISQFLTDHAIPHSTGWVENGIVATISGEGAGETIALRADMDALPIQETNDVTYRSQVPGCMHACGHDVHSASLMGVAKILWELRPQLSGTVRLIWQPGEEKLPGGASLMIKEGVLDDPTPVAIYGQHVHPPLQVGKVGYRAGKYMASADEIYLTVIGKGGHAALPQDGVDTVLLSARILDALQAVASRLCDPSIPTVLSFGKINSVGGATNVIPDQVKIEGTFRTMNEEWRFRAHDHIRRIAKLTAESLGGSCEVDIKVGYPCLINHDGETEIVASAMKDYLGEKNVVELPIRLTAEDFSYYSQISDACFYRLGTGNPDRGITSPVHTSTFDIDENALEVGMGLMSFLAITRLQSN